MPRQRMMQGPGADKTAAPPSLGVFSRARGESTNTADRAIGREGSVVIGDAISPSTQQF